jgi:hypothetical protein
MPPGAVLKQLNLSANDILNTATSVKVPGSTTSSQQSPFIILAAVKDRGVAATLLENIKASKDLFTDADIVDVTQNSTENKDANSLTTTANKYPYQVTINAYLKKINPQRTTASKAGGTQ